jgi:hypothetical protein
VIGRQLDPIGANRQVLELNGWHHHRLQAERAQDGQDATIAWSRDKFLFTNESAWLKWKSRIDEDNSL